MKNYSQQKVLCNWGLTLKQSSAVHIQALVSLTFELHTGQHHQYKWNCGKKNLLFNKAGGGCETLANRSVLFESNKGLPKNTCAVITINFLLSKFVAATSLAETESNYENYF